MSELNFKTEQQTSTFSYFNNNANDWREKAKVDSDSQVNVIQQRNDYVLSVAAGRDQTGSALDVGCGTGELVVELAKRGIAAKGIDFSDEMIKLCQQSVQQQNHSLAQFECCSVFDYEFHAAQYDLISANGFIEYISLAELRQFIEKSVTALKNNGSLVLGSRNRLFNLFSMNQFTAAEIELGSCDLLLRESIALQNVRNINELIHLQSIDLEQTHNCQHNTGIDVALRHQYTPVQLAKLLAEYGFSIHQVSPIHIHGLTPTAKSSMPSIHGEIANYLQKTALNNPLFIPHASSFMIHAVKKGNNAQ